MAEDSDGGDIMTLEQVLVRGTHEPRSFERPGLVAVVIDDHNRDGELVPTLVYVAAADVVGPAPATPCCDLHNRNCEPPSELCCDSCSEWDHPGHASGTECIAPDLSGNGPTPATPDVLADHAYIDRLVAERNEARAALAAAEAERDATNALISSARISLDQVTAEGDVLAGIVHALEVELASIKEGRALSVEAAGTEGGGGHE
jgi:hypothetical protein